MVILRKTNDTDKAVSSKRRRERDPAFEFINCEADTERGTASGNLEWAGNLKPGDGPVSLICRVSTSQQRRHLRDQAADMRERLEARGIAVDEKVYYHDGNGSDTDWLGEVFQDAEKRGIKILAAETPNRLARHPEYTTDAEHCRLQARKCDWDKIASYRKGTGIRLCVMIDPDATAEEEAGYEKRRGQRQTGNKGGRPPKPKPGDKKRLKLEHQARVRRLHAAGLTLEEIVQFVERQHGVHLSMGTVWRWTR